MNTRRIEWDFGYHAPPSSSDRQRQHARIRGLCAQLAHAINDACPDSREKSLAITKIEEAMFWANAAIARQDRPEHAV
jgi:hypothetical protein